MNGLKEIKPLHFLTASIILIGLIGGGFFFVGQELGSMKANASGLSKDVNTLKQFKEKGDRFTKADGTRLESNMKELASKVEGYPFFMEEVRELKDNVIKLTAAMSKLELAITMVRFQYEQISKRLDQKKPRIEYPNELINPEK